MSSVLCDKYKLTLGPSRLEVSDSEKSESLPSANRARSELTVFGRSMRSSTGSRVVIATRVFLFVQAFLDIKAARYRGEEDYSDRYLIWSKIQAGVFVATSTNMRAVTTVQAG